MSNLNTKSRRSHGRCIFCDGPGLSKEHIWSDWLKEIFPSNDAHGELWASLQFDRLSNAFRWDETPQETSRQGSVLQRKVRNVCKQCNNGWMSQVVQRAKPHLTKMIRGESFRLNVEEQSDLAGWIAITTVMQEFANRRGIRKITPEDRRELMRTEIPPINWSIWIARYDGVLWAPMNHYCIPISYSKGSLSDERASDEPPLHGLQLTTFTLGQLLVHVFTSTHDEMVRNYRSYIGQSTMILRLWPLAGNELVWPPHQPFEDAETDRLAFGWVEDKWNVRDLPGRPLAEFMQRLSRFASQLSDSRSKLAGA